MMEQIKRLQSEEWTETLDVHSHIFAVNKVNREMPIS